MKTSATKSEQDDNTRLANAKQFLDSVRVKETEARVALSDAIETVKRAKERYENLFAECEKRAVARRKSGQIVVNPGY